MRFIKSLRVNTEAILKLVILLGFAIFFCIIIQSGQAQLYVHPRIIPYIKFAVGAMILISLFIGKDVFKPARKRVNLLPYLFFVIPLVMAFALPAKPLTSTSMATSNIKIAQQSQNTSASNSGSNASSSLNAGSENKKLKQQRDTVILDDSSFAAWIQELNDKIDKYDGKKIQLTGFVFKNSDFKQNEFVTARFMMSCCTADAQVVGLLGRYDKAPEFKNDTWLKVTGTLKKTDYNGGPMLVIDVDGVNKVAKPEDEYVYPY